MIDTSHAMYLPARRAARTVAPLYNRERPRLRPQAARKESLPPAPEPPPHHTTLQEYCESRRAEADVWGSPWQRLRLFNPDEYRARVADIGREAHLIAEAEAYARRRRQRRA